MRYNDFYTAIDKLVPEHRKEAAACWLSCAFDLVERDIFVDFEPISNKLLAVQNWLDALCCGFRAVNREFGQKAAEAVINLGCDHVYPFPGQMMQAAICLERGMDANEIRGLLDTDKIIFQDLFVPASRYTAEQLVDSEGIVRCRRSVLSSLSTTRHQPENKKSAPRKSAERER